MKAAVLKTFGSPLVVETMPDPVLGTGEVIVEVAATRMLAYADEVFSGKRNYLLNVPVIPGPGGIGRVRAVGPDATRLAVGDWVFCDPTVRSRDDAQAPDILLQGWTAGTEGGLRLQKHFRHGSFAEQMRVPTENVTPIGDIDDSEAPLWCALGTLLVPYGGLATANLTAGETVLINGATGAFGSAGVAVALAMGASAIIATGRNEKALADLVRRFGDRVRTARMLGKEEDDRACIHEAAAGPIDCVLDLLPPAANASQVRTAALTVRPHGRVILMGGLTGNGGVELPYTWLMRNGITLRGQFMYSRADTRRVIGLVRAGLIDLNEFQVTAFGLDKVNDAVAHAAVNAGPFKMTVLRP